LASRVYGDLKLALRRVNFGSRNGVLELLRYCLLCQLIRGGFDRIGSALSAATGERTRDPTCNHPDRAAGRPGCNSGGRAFESVDKTHALSSLIGIASIASSASMQM